MVKKIIFIVIAIILFVADICIQSNYNYDTTKIVIRNNMNLEQLIELYVNDIFEQLKSNDFEKVYDKVQVDDFTNLEEFSKYITEEILVSDSMVSVEEIKQVAKNKYSLKVKVDSPLFTPKEKLEIEAYKKKYINLVLQFDDLFSYKILEFKKI